MPMNDNTHIAAAATALYDAREARQPIDPVSTTFGIANDDAYQVQETNTRKWLGDGRAICGRKIGLTSEAVQKQLGVDQPDFGILFADMGYANGEEIPSASFIQPRAETEVALILGRDLNDMVSDIRSLQGAIDCLLPAVEIVDSAIRDWRINFVDTVADNASSAAFVLGDDRMRPDDVDLEIAGMVTRKNGAIASFGVGAACLGHPFEAAVWLVNKMVEVGRPLTAGEVILTGALGPMFAIQPGDHVDARIAGLGSVSFSLTS